MNHKENLQIVAASTSGRWVDVVGHIYTLDERTEGRLAQSIQGGNAEFIKHVKDSEKGYQAYIEYAIDLEKQMQMMEERHKRELSALRDNYSDVVNFYNRRCIGGNNELRKEER